MNSSGSKILLSVAIAAAMAAISYITASAAPVRQLRSAWIVTGLGLDWPQLTYTPDEQRESLDRMLDRIAAANFNTVFIQLQIEGDVLWQSSLQPAAADVTGSPSMPMPYDVAAYAIEQAHQRGLDIYAVINPLDVGSRGAAYRYADNPIPHPINDLPQRLVGSGRHMYINPGTPDNIDYLRDLYAELIDNYDIDGIVIDRVEYPAGDFDDAATYADYRTAPQQPLEEWRRDNLDNIVTTVSTLAEERRPGTKIILTVDGASSTTDGLKSIPRYQELLDNGTIDYVVAKIYNRGTNGFSPTLESWIGTQYTPQTIMALTSESGYNATTNLPLSRQIEMATDDADIPGIVIYRTSPITDTGHPMAAERYAALRDDIFLTPAHVPPVPGWEKTTPAAPEMPKVERDGHKREYVISWDAPPLDAEATPIKYYTVYIARDGVTDVTDPHSELVHRVDTTEYVYPSDEEGLEFAITAFDINGNESAPAFTGGAEGAYLDSRPYVFRFYADNLFVAAPKAIKRLEIFTMWGNRVKYIPVDAPEVTVECGDLKGGVYVVHTIYTDGSSDTNKFIK